MNSKDSSSPPPLTEGSIHRHLVRLTLPLVYGYFSVMLFNLADTFFVAQLGDDPLEAISFTLPITTLVVGIGVSLGVGISIVVAQLWGQRKYQETRELALHGILLSATFFTLFATLGHATVTSLFRLQGAPDDLMPLITEYMRLWYVSVVFLGILMSANAILRGSGNTRAPARIMLMVAVLNAILDPIMIFGLFGFPRLEIQGAAIATMISWFIALLISLFLLYRKYQLLELAVPKVNELLSAWKKILVISIPTVLNISLIPMGLGFITAMLAMFSSEAVAAFGVGMRLEPVLLSVTMALSGAVTPFVAQNWAANKGVRILKAIRRIFRFVMAYGLVVAVAAAASAPQLAALFSEDEIIQANITFFLRTYPITYCFNGLKVISTSVFISLHMTGTALLLTLLQTVILLVPMTYLGGEFGEARGVIYGAIIATLIAGSFSYLWTMRTVTRIARIPERTNEQTAGSEEVEG